MKSFTLLLVLAAGMAFASSAKGDTFTYTYVGNALTNTNPSFPFFPFVPGVAPCSCSVDGSFTMANAIPEGPGLGGQSAVAPIAWSFSVGSDTLTQFNSTISASVDVNSSGIVQFWGIQVVGSDLEIFTQFVGSGFEATDALFDTNTNTVLAYGQADRGTWSYADPLGVPEPSTPLLLGVGLLLVVVSKGFARR
jgi:hypothetical protein